MKFWTYATLAILCYLYSWSTLGNIGFKNASMYIAMSPYGNTVASTATMITYLVAPMTAALLLWLIGHLIIWLILLPFKRMQSKGN